MPRCNPGQQLSIDESMIGTKCCLSFIQYLPAKPTKWEIKVWVWSDAVTGCILSFSIYTGKDPNVSISPNGFAYNVMRFRKQVQQRLLNICRQFLHKPELVSRLVQ